MNQYLGAQPNSGKTFVVSPGGNDSNPGTADRPKASIASAVEAARLSGPANNRIIVRPGKYFLLKPVELDARDNGLIIEADSGGKAILYGGTIVTGWKREGENLWYAEMPGVREGKWDFRALIVNGRMPERARMPDSGTFLHKSVFDVPLIQRIGWGRQPTKDELTKMLYDPADIPENLDIRNAEVRIYNMWTESLLAINKNDIQKHELTFATPALFGMGAFGRKDYIIWNTREGMTRPGRWFLDRTAGRLYYWPLKGEDMTTSEVIAPVLESIIRISSTTGKKAENITIRGLALQSTTTPLLGPGLRAHAFDGALSVTNAENCYIEKLDISLAGGMGIAATEFNNSKITGCHVHDLGAGGIRISGVNVLCSGNHIHDAGLYYPSAVGLYVRGGHDYRIFHNEIHDITYSGMNLYSDNSDVEDNLIYRVMRELHDGGGIYIAGSGYCTIRGNVARDISAMGTGFGISSYYLDEGCHDCTIENNVSINVSRPVHNHIARNSVIRNNVFITDEDMTLSFQSSAGFTFEGNTLVSPGKIQMVSPNGISSWQNNRVFRGGSVAGKFTIDSLMPVSPVPAQKTSRVEVVPCLKAPVLDGVISVDEWVGEYYRLDREPSRLPYSGAPVITKYNYDSKNLYISGMMMMIDTMNINKGSSWGKDDGVEIAIRGSVNGKPVTYVVRSFVNGTLQSISDAGAPAQAAATLGKTIRYSAKVMANPTRGWTGEWIIPFKSLGIKPVPGQEVQFNITAYVNEYGKWHCWEGTGGQSWEVDRGGLLRFK